MPSSNLLTSAAILLGSLAITAGLYASPTQQLAREKLACAQQDGMVRFEPGKGITENKLTERCKKLLDSRIEVKVNWPGLP